MMLQMNYNVVFQYAIRYCAKKLLTHLNNTGPYVPLNPLFVFLGQWKVTDMKIEYDKR